MYEHSRLAFAGVAVLVLLACAEENGASLPPADAGSSQQGERCSPAEGTTGSPSSIHEVLDLINGLPHPVELPCFLESLDRPLALNANFNTQSAQPALGKRSPRIFILPNEPFSMSLVPGEPTLEFGERDASALVSVKGELHFPIEGQLIPEDAFVRLAPDEATGLTLDEGTSCGVCHDNEKPAPGYPFRGAFSSARLRPAPFFFVEVAAIRQELESCEAALEPERCALLHAMFDHGEVVQAPFP
jgi:hypothetical protein